MGHHPLHPPPKHREFLPEMLGRDERGQHLGHGDHCLGQAGPSARVAASAITSTSLLAAVPSAHPPSPLCMRHHNRLPGGGRGRKDGEREPGALPRPQPQTTGLPWSSGSKKKKKAPALLCSSSSPDPSFPPHHPGTPCPFQHPSAVMTPPGWNSLLLAGRRLQKALSGEGGRHGRIRFPNSPPPGSGSLAL